MNYINYRMNPIVQISSTDTLQHCTDSLTYIIETLPGLVDAESTHSAYRGLRNLIECIELALEYEFYRLQDTQPPESTGQ